MTLVELFFTVLGYLFIVMVLSREAYISYQLENWRDLSIWSSLLCAIPASYFMMQFIPLPLSPYIDYVVFVIAVFVFLRREKHENLKIVNPLELTEGQATPQD